jgi:hypothetical protein
MEEVVVEVVPYFRSYSRQIFERGSASMVVGEIEGQIGSVAIVSAALAITTESRAW